MIKCERKLEKLKKIKQQCIKVESGKGRQSFQRFNWKLRSTRGLYIVIMLSSIDYIVKLD